MGTGLWQDGADQQVFHCLFIPTFAHSLSILVLSPFQGLCIVQSLSGGDLGLTRWAMLHSNLEIVIPRAEGELMWHCLEMAGPEGQSSGGALPWSAHIPADSLGESGVAGLKVSANHNRRRYRCVSKHQMAPWCIYITYIRHQVDALRDSLGLDRVGSGVVGTMNAARSRPDWLATVQSCRKQAQSRVCTPGFRDLLEGRTLRDLLEGRSLRDLLEGCLCLIL